MRMHTGENGGGGGIGTTELTETVQTAAQSADMVGRIMDYEAGTLDDLGTLELFAHLVHSGMAWSLQGAYGRAAQSLIEGGMISEAGEITEKARNLLADLSEAQQEVDEETELSG